jgi:hypothetical protein
LQLRTQSQIAPVTSNNLKNTIFSSNQLQNRNIKIDDAKYSLYNNFRNQSPIVLSELLNFNPTNILHDDSVKKINNISTSYNILSSYDSNQFLLESGYMECPFHHVKTQWYNVYEYISYI